MYVLNIRSVPQLSEANFHAGLSHSTQFPKIFIHFVHLLKDIYSDHTEKPGRMTDVRMSIINKDVVTKRLRTQ